MRYLGVDLAWGEGSLAKPANRSGVVTLESDGRIFCAGWTIGLDETVEWIETNAIADTLLFVDAPLVVDNENGQRLAERQVGQRYGKWWVSANSTNTKSPRQAGVHLRQRLEERGWHYDDGLEGPPRQGLIMSECYPYTTIVGAPELSYDDKRPPYKRAKKGVKAADAWPLRTSACDELIRRVAALIDNDVQSTSCRIPRPQPSSRIRRQPSRRPTRSEKTSSTPRSAPGRQRCGTASASNAVRCSASTASFQRYVPSRRSSLPRGWSSAQLHEVSAGGCSSRGGAASAGSRFRPGEQRRVSAGGILLRRFCVAFGPATREASDVDPDFHIRLAAIDRLQSLQLRYEDMIPRREILENIVVDGEPYALLNPQAGIHRPRRFRGPAALTIVTAAPKASRPPPYDDAFDEATGTIVYSYRDGHIDSADNRALRAACVEQVPLIYLMGIAPSVYALSAPVFVVQDMPTQRAVLVQIGSRATDLTPAGIRSDIDLRRYALREARYRLHQHQFRFSVLAAYRQRCTICALKERSLLQAAHIVDDAHGFGQPSVRNGLSLCAIHHLAYDRHVLGIDPEGTVHIASRLLEEEDGPMLRQGLQGFHLERVTMPRRPQDRPDPERLGLHYDRFLAA